MVKWTLKKGFKRLPLWGGSHPLSVLPTSAIRWVSFRYPRPNSEDWEQPAKSSKKQSRGPSIIRPNPHTALKHQTKRENHRTLSANVKQSKLTTKSYQMTPPKFHWWNHHNIRRTSMHTTKKILTKPKETLYSDYPPNNNSPKKTQQPPNERFFFFRKAKTTAAKADRVRLPNSEAFGAELFRWRLSSWRNEANVKSWRSLWSERLCFVRQGAFVFFSFSGGFLDVFFF